MRTTKKALSIVLAGLMTVGGMSVFSVSAAQTSTPTLSFKTQNALYAHAVSGSDDSDAWVAWQCKHNEDMEELNTNRKYFFLPSSVSSTSVELYNAYSKSVTVNNVTIPSGESREVSYTIDKAGNVTADGKTYSLTFLKSSAESAIYVNNSNADGNGKDLISYLNEDKSNYSSATGAIVDRNGKIDNTSIKKIKGRGNSTWGKAKKPYNITYSDKVSIGGMSKGKKFSLLANYQDDSLTRNRFLYDLADAVGTPYASDSRYVDFYSDGYYWGSYQMTEKIEVGKKIQNNNMDEALQAKAAVVDFSAVWCGPCQMLAPVLEELADDLDGKVAFYNADTDENTQLAIANGITNIPALLFLKDGKVAGKNVGFMPKPELEAWVKGCMEQ